MSQSSFAVRRPLAVLALFVAAVAGRGVAQGAAAPQPIDPKWLKVDTVKKTADFQLVAGLTGLNGALNFNGFRDGELTFTVPLNWTVVLHFVNHDGILPHSAEVIADQKPVPVGPVAPVFDRAATGALQEGLTSGQGEVVRFLAKQTGSFLIFCAVPGHGAAGMWIRLKVDSAATAPSMALTAPRAKP